MEGFRPTPEQRRLTELQGLIEEAIAVFDRRRSPDQRPAAEEASGAYRHAADFLRIGLLTVPPAPQDPRPPEQEGGEETAPQCDGSGRITEKRRAPVTEEWYAADLGSCPGCAACQPAPWWQRALDKQAEYWRGLLLHHEQEGDRAAAARSKDRLEALTLIREQLAVFAPAPANDSDQSQPAPAVLSDEDRERLREAARLLRQTTEGPDPYSDDLIRFLRKLADKQGGNDA